MDLNYYCDDQRHLVCVPYSIENLHRMADDLGIKKCWFHKNHYDIPKKRIGEIKNKCIFVSPKEIVTIIKNGGVDLSATTNSSDTSANQ
jgi:hypothetical protein